MKRVSDTPSGRGNGSSTASRPRGYTRWQMLKVWIVAVLMLPLWLSLGLLTIFVKQLPPWIVRKLLLAHNRYTCRAVMDLRIPQDKSVAAYMHRWWRIPRNAFFNIYYHVVLRSDDDRALHDHPFWSLSIVLEGGYYEHTILAGGIHKKVWRGPGSIVFRPSGRFAHRLELMTYPWPDPLVPDEWSTKSAKTIFITGPVLRRWGFHDARHGWIDAYDWDEHCERYGIKAMRMDGGSDAVVSERNRR